MVCLLNYNHLRGCKLFSAKIMVEVPPTKRLKQKMDQGIFFPEILWLQSRSLMII